MGTAAYGHSVPPPSDTHGDSPSSAITVGPQIDDSPLGPVHSGKLGDRPVRLTVIDPAIFANDDARDTLIADVQRARAVQHRNLVETLGIFPLEDAMVVVHAEPEGTSVRDFLATRRDTGDPLSVLETYTLCAHACAALVTVQQTMCHGYLTLDTLFVTPKGRVLVGGLGLGQALSYAERFDAFAAEGALCSIAPEQLRVPPQLVAGSDVFGMGMVMVQLLTCLRVPGPGEQLADLGIIEPSALAFCLERAIAPSPTARQPDIEAFRAELRDAIATLEPTDTPAEPPVHRAGSLGVLMDGDFAAPASEPSLAEVFSGPRPVPFSRPPPLPTTHGAAPAASARPTAPRLAPPPVPPLAPPQIRSRAESPPPPPRTAIEPPPVPATQSADDSFFAGFALDVEGLTEDAVLEVGEVTVPRPRVAPPRAENPQKTKRPAAASDDLLELAHEDNELDRVEADLGPEAEEIEVEEEVRPLSALAAVHARAAEPAPPPPEPPGNYMVVRGGLEHGPYTLEQLKELLALGRLVPVDSVRRERTTKTTLVVDLPGMRLLCERRMRQSQRARSASVSRVAPAAAQLLQQARAPTPWGVYASVLASFAVLGLVLWLLWPKLGPWVAQLLRGVL